jgi:hypothetical protein
MLSVDNNASLFFDSFRSRNLLIAEARIGARSSSSFRLAELKDYSLLLFGLYTESSNSLESPFGEIIGSVLGSVSVRVKAIKRLTSSLASVNYSGNDASIPHTSPDFFSSVERDWVDVLPVAWLKAAKIVLATNAIELSPELSSLLQLIFQLV